MASNLVTWPFSRVVLPYHIMWFWKVAYIKYFISPLTFDQLVLKMQGGDRLWGAPPLNSYNTLNMCSREVTWQVKNIITFLLSQCLWLQVLSGWWHTASSSPQSGDLARSCDNLNTLYLHLQKIHGHKTWQGSDLPVTECHL